MSGILTLDLPYPTSANKLWRMGGGKPHKSREYEAWQTKALLSLFEQPRGRFGGPFAMSLLAGRPDNRKRDIDNLIKGTLDLLKRAGIIADDKDCQRLSAEWWPDLVGIRVTISETKRVAA